MTELTQGEALSQAWARRAAVADRGRADTVTVLRCDLQTLLDVPRQRAVGDDAVRRALKALQDTLKRSGSGGLAWNIGASRAAMPAMRAALNAALGGSR